MHVQLHVCVKSPVFPTRNMALGLIITLTPPSFTTPRMGSALER